MRLVYRFIGNADTKQNHLGIRSLMNETLRRELKRTIASVCGARERIIFVESGPHDWSNQMYCHPDHWPPPHKYDPGLDIHTTNLTFCYPLQDDERPSVVTDRRPGYGFIPVSVTESFVNISKHVLPWVETLAPTRLWLSR